jgi:hypothetical protein
MARHGEWGVRTQDKSGSGEKWKQRKAAFSHQRHRETEEAGSEVDTRRIARRRK